jgi:hypothetical protein
MDKDWRNLRFHRQPSQRAEGLTLVRQDDFDGYVIQDQFKSIGENQGVAFSGRCGPPQPFQNFPQTK